ncbi:MAG TPA: hypothetical protein PKC23_10170 [Candidatus Desulfobacillus sp.]|nr:hypothetical protein [Candidatus Desulfobacillus sp.]
MGLVARILGPKSKYEKSLPYSYEARVRVFEDGSDPKTYLSDTICGLVEHLERNRVDPAATEIFEIFQERETPIDARRFVGAGGRWMTRPELCRSFEQHYPGHIHATGCSFEDRERGCAGP